MIRAFQRRHRGITQLAGEVGEGRKEKDYRLGNWGGEKGKGLEAWKGDITQNGRVKIIKKDEINRLVSGASVQRGHIAHQQKKRCAEARFTVERVYLKGRRNEEGGQAIVMSQAAWTLYYAPKRFAVHHLTRDEEL
ncbi:hypothetical protein VNO77_08771 [Canavalia gladiata]|uniref:Uncharacterized protein n=1 Tax=Canavalia gladiata TaxID=3824 RepID=A0AAN9M9J8_CANGL